MAEIRFKPTSIVTLTFKACFVSHADFCRHMFMLNHLDDLIHEENAAESVYLVETMIV